MSSILYWPRALLWLFRPTLEGLFTQRLPWVYRWRLLVLQPLSLLTLGLNGLPWAFSNAYSVDYIPVAPGLTLRALVFRPPPPPRKKSTPTPTPTPTALPTDAPDSPTPAPSPPAAVLPPLHINFHGGGFIGGWPEDDALFCAQLAREACCVVVSVSYPYAPAHVFPAAHDAADAAVAWLRGNARQRYGADVGLTTAGGFSAGGNLALAAAQARGARWTDDEGIKGVLAFYPPIDLRLKPAEKPIPTNVNFPKKDPLFALFGPLYDCYAGPVREANMENHRMSPVLADPERGEVPPDVMLVVAGIDILVDEQMKFADRVKAVYEKEPEKYKDRSMEVVYDIKGFHGYLNCESAMAASSLLD